MSSRNAPPSSVRGPRVHVRGSAVLMRATFVRNQYGDPGMERYQRGASDALLRALKAAEKIDEWVDYSVFIEATELVDKLFGRGDNRLAWDVGRFAAEHNMGLWKSIAMRLMSPETVLAISAGLWGHHYDAGKLVVEDDGHGGLRLWIRDFPLPHRAHCLSIGGWVERSLELGGPRAVDVREEKCRAFGADACQFSLRWG